MMLSPAQCGAVVAVLLLPWVWSAAASALRALLHRSDIALSDHVEKIVLALLLAPSVIGLGAVAFAALPQAPSAPLPLMDFVFVDMGAGAASFVATGGEARLPWLQIGVSAFAWLYAAGALLAALRLIVAQLRLVRIARRAENASHIWGAGVAITDVEMSPFVGAGGKIIVPRTLSETLPPQQIALIIAHERAHVRRGDGPCYALLSWIDALFWFNPFVRAQTARCRFAAELACDAAVTASAPEMRRAYAQALLSALKHTAGDALQCAPAVFSTRIVGEHRMRIREIMQGGAQGRKRSAAVVYAAACLAAAPIVTLQIALAETNSVDVVAAMQAAPSAVSAAFDRAPISGEVRSAFGERANPLGGAPQFHNGVDYDAPEGAEIVAPASGRVTRARERGGYGNLLEIDHGGGLVTRYAHLSAFEVSEGAQVAAGQVIARVGNTGRSTHPHLHFVVLRDGAPVDPQPLLPGAR